MTLQKFISRLSWRQILIHLIAYWFFIHAFLMFSYLFHIRLVDAMSRANGKLNSPAFTDKGFTGADVLTLSAWLSVAGFIGLLVAFILSVVVSVRRHRFWVNALITTVAMYFLYVYNLLGWAYVSWFFGFPGRIFNNTTAFFIITGIILLAIALLTCFYKWPKQWAGNKKPVLA